MIVELVACIATQAPQHASRGEDRKPLPAERPTHRIAAPPTASPSSRWDALAACESGGNWQSRVGMFEGGVQFLNATWLAQGGGRFAQHAYDATKAQQIIIAERVLASGGWSQWPVCSVQAGLA